MNASNSSRYRPLAVLLLAYLALSSSSRLLLWLCFGTAANVGVPQLPVVLLSGVVNDAVQALYLFLPLALYLLLVTPRFHASRAGRALLFAGGYVMVYGMLYLAALEYFFFEEFDARFNLVAVDYLIYPTEVLGTIRDGYPVGLISARIAVVAALIFWLLWPRMVPRAEDVPPRFGRRTLVFGAQLGLVALAVALYSTDQLDASDNRVANELAHNGPSSFFNAFRTNSIEYPAYYRTGDKQAMLKLLREDLARGGGEFVDD